VRRVARHRAEGWAGLVRPRGAARLAWALSVTWTLATLPASASETEWWIVERSADHGESESRGVVVRADGTMALGPAAVRTPVDSVEVLWAIAVRADGSLVLGGDSGRLFTWTRSSGVRPWVRLDAGQVLSLAADGNDVIAGTAPRGVVYRVRPNGDTLRVATTGERYVWALAPAGGGAWYAATGVRGRLMRLGRGAPEIVLDTEEINLVSLVTDGKGGVFAGGDSKGRVVHVASDGEARTLFDAPEDEIRALSYRGGVLHAAALSSKAVRDGDEEDPERPAPRSSGAGSRDRSVVYRIVPDSAVTRWWESPYPVVFGAVPIEQGLAVATGNRGAVFVVDDLGGATRWLAVAERQITALAVLPGGGIAAATANPAALWLIGPGTAREGELLSPVFDAKRIARFGRVLWKGEAGGGRVALHTRTGNTPAPDTTWSAWRPLREGRSVAPAARHVQWRLTLGGEKAAVGSVELAWRENNLPPWAGNLRVAPQGRGVREGGLSPRSEPVTQELPEGRRVEFSLKRRTDDREMRSLPDWMNGLRVVEWTAIDPNEDRMVFDLDVVPAEGRDWLPLARELADSSFVWDTQKVPDGRYRLRVNVSDSPDNAVGEERSAMAVSGHVVVDNTPPEVEMAGVTGEPGAVRVRGRASDATSPLWRIEAAVDDGPWRTLTPDGGLTDGLTHTFDVRVKDVEPGEHAVRVRVVDRSGNVTIDAARVTVPR
jgi:hypothetical protein